MLHHINIASRVRNTRYAALPGRHAASIRHRRQELMPFVLRCASVLHKKRHRAPSGSGLNAFLSLAFNVKSIFILWVYRLALFDYYLEVRGRNENKQPRLPFILYYINVPIFVLCLLFRLLQASFCIQRCACVLVLCRLCVLSPSSTPPILQLLGQLASQRIAGARTNRERLEW